MKTLTLLLAVTLTGLVAYADDAPGQNLALERIGRLFGKTAAFTATGHVTVLDGSGLETVSEMEYAALDGRLRMDIDITKTKTTRKGKPVKKRSDDNEGMASLGLNKFVTLVLPDKDATYLIYPGLKAYCQAPKKKSNGPDGKTDWKEAGPDTIDGHPCIKYTVTTAGSTEQTTAWKATDLNDFVIQTVSIADGETTTVKFANIKPGKPAASLFELPAEYRRYGSVQEMMMSAMQQMMMQGFGR